MGREFRSARRFANAVPKLRRGERGLSLLRLCRGPSSIPAREPRNRQNRAGWMLILRNVAWRFGGNMVVPIQSKIDMPAEVCISDGVTKSCMLHRLRPRPITARPGRIFRANIVRHAILEAVAIGSLLPWLAPPAPRRAARLHAAGRAPAVCLFYHRVADDRLNPWTISQAAFERQIHWLQRRFEMVSLSEAQRRLRSGAPFDRR